MDELNARTKSSLYIGTGVGLYSSGGQVLELQGNEVDHALRSGYEIVIAFMHLMWSLSTLRETLLRSGFSNTTYA